MDEKMAKVTNGSWLITMSLHPSIIVKRQSDSKKKKKKQISNKFSVNLYFWKNRTSLLTKIIKSHLVPGAGGSRL
jgi:hypothetical protein